MILRAGVIGLAEFLNSEFVPNFYPDPGGAGSMVVVCGVGNKPILTSLLPRCVSSNGCKGALLPFFAIIIITHKLWEAKNGRSLQN